MNKNKILILTTLLLALTSLGAAQGTSTNLKIDLMYAEPVPLQAGQYADLWIRVTNTGDAKAEKPRFKIIDNYPFTPTDKSTFEVARGGLGPNEHRDIRTQIKVNENAVFGNNTLKINATAGNQDIWIEEKIPLEVRTDQKSLMVKSLDFPDRVEPGSSAQMNITLENLANSKFRNIDISLDTSNLPASTQETSRRRISSINSGQAQKVSYNIAIDPSAENKLHNLPIEIDYEDQAGNDLSTSETTGVNIGGFPEIDVEIEESDIRTKGKGKVTLRIVNKGEGRARFTEVKLKERKQYEVLSEDSIYLGSMIADDFQTAEFSLYVKEGKKLQVPVKVTYKDGKGEQSKTFNIERELYNSQELRKYGIKQGSNQWIFLAAILAALGAAAFYWKRKRNSKE
jgi:hypothetical protein